VGVTTVDFTSYVMAKKGPPSVYTGPALTTAICANRISYAFDLRGPSVAIDTACSASLVCGNLALGVLRERRCTGALVLGVNVQLEPYWTEVFAEAGMLSPNGRCRFGDDAADGYVRGEGCAGLLLLPGGDLEGERTAQSPYAIAVGSAVNQDGRSNGLTAPNPAEQLSLLETAWRTAGLPASAASYVEAHGTGTALGDPIEVSALGRALRGKSWTAEASATGIPALRTASFKSNIGHLECGAGGASLLKLSQVLHRGTIPASLHLRVLNRHINWDDSGVEVITAPECLVPPGAPRDSGVPHGGVSGFGFGGTNGHIVLRAPARERQLHRAHGVQRLQVVPLVGHSATALADSARRLGEWVQASSFTANGGSESVPKALPQRMTIDGVACAAAHRAMQVSASSAKMRASVIASSLPELGRRLAMLEEELQQSKPSLAANAPPKVALALIGPDEPRASMILHSLAAVAASTAEEEEDTSTPGLAGLCAVLRTCGPGPLDPSAVACAALCAAAAMLVDDLGIAPCAVLGHGLAAMQPHLLQQVQSV